ncbi:234_t:CDS:2 [Ambispora leptoticha]|uniref:234_t:CDS:1 n=1 Tax=Ambispora leptoticha TaxID=144679 RepID=A0A9N8ZSR9_9GLOM|nr:234_t:CDS:2 [Ambispora leptoticha]
MESILEKVERITLIIDDINLEKTFEDYYNDDIIDLRPGLKFTKEVFEII